MVFGIGDRPAVAVYVEVDIDDGPAVVVDATAAAVDIDKREQVVQLAEKVANSVTPRFEMAAATQLPVCSCLLDPLVTGSFEIVTVQLIVELVLNKSPFLHICLTL